jgi:hypothetical protein
MKKVADKLEELFKNKREDFENEMWDGPSGCSSSMASFRTPSSSKGLTKFCRGSRHTEKRSISPLMSTGKNVKDIHSTDKDG